MPIAHADNLPQQEKDRLDIMHHLITLRLDNRLHLAPIENSVQRILDLGTGTGIWAIEMGKFGMLATLILHVFQRVLSATV
jgi:ubiquinone/menaquinone biosynthesis C-methylase UbiE